MTAAAAAAAVRPPGAISLPGPESPRLALPTAAGPGEPPVSGPFAGEFGGFGPALVRVVLGFSDAVHAILEGRRGRLPDEKRRQVEGQLLVLFASVAERAFGRAPLTTKDAAGRVLEMKGWVTWCERQRNVSLTGRNKSAGPLAERGLREIKADAGNARTTCARQGDLLRHKEVYGGRGGPAGAAAAFEADAAPWLSAPHLSLLHWLALLAGNQGGSDATPPSVALGRVVSALAEGTLGRPGVLAGDTPTLWLLLARTGTEMLARGAGRAWPVAHDGAAALGLSDLTTAAGVPVTQWWTGQIEGPNPTERVRRDLEHGVALISLAAWAALAHAVCTRDGFYAQWGPALHATLDPVVQFAPALLLHASRGLFGTGGLADIKDVVDVNKLVQAAGNPNPTHPNPTKAPKAPAASASPRHAAVSQEHAVERLRKLAEGLFAARRAWYVVTAAGNPDAGAAAAEAEGRPAPPPPLVEALVVLAEEVERSILRYAG